MSIKSPVTGQNNTKLLEKVDVAYIIKGYKDLLGMDVSRFFSDLSSIDIYQCNDTGFRFYYPETIFGDASFYAELQQKDFYYNKWIWENDLALNQIDQGSSILEVGCGTGTFMEVLSHKGFDITGLELNNSAVKVCKEKVLKVYNELLEQHIQQHVGRYDVVCSFQVLEHVYDVHSFIDCCIQCLKPGGKLIIAVPNNNPWYNVYDKLHIMNLPPHHSGLWDKNAFKNLTGYFPLTTLKIKAEPLYNRLQFFNIWLKHKKYFKLQKFISKLHPGIVNRLLWPLRWFVAGKCIIAIFEKNK